MLDVGRYFWVTGWSKSPRIAEYSFVTHLLQSCAKLGRLDAPETYTKPLMNTQ